jgi:membrane protease YdiL (CAAX protease family)
MADVEPARSSETIRPLPPATWRVREAIGLYLAVVVVAATVVGFVLGLDALSCAGRSLVSLGALQMALLATVVLYVRRVRKSPLAALGYANWRGSDATAGFAVGLGLYAVALGVTLLISALITVMIGHAPDAPEQVTECVRGPALWAFGVGAVILTPVAEETFFRGFLYRGLRRGLAVRPAAVVSGTLFGLVHFAGVEYLLIIPSLVIVGVGLASLFERRQSVLASIAAHATFNLVGVISIAAVSR